MKFTPYCVTLLCDNCVTVTHVREQFYNVRMVNHLDWYKYTLFCGTDGYNQKCFNRL